MIFEKRDLVSAIMASSAFPSLMDPVKIGDSLYIDGEMTTNYPSKSLTENGYNTYVNEFGFTEQGLSKANGEHSSLRREKQNH